MGTDGSGPRTSLPASLASVAVGFGWLAMIVAGPSLVRGLGLRPALLLSELVLVLPALLFLLLLGMPLLRALALRRLGAAVVGLSLAAGAAFWGASLGLLEVQYALWRPPDGYLEGFRRLYEALTPSGPFDALVSLAAIALAPAFFEETLFRGLVLPAFLRSFGAAAAVAASAALFGLIHLDLASLVLGLTKASLAAISASAYRVPFAFAVGVGLGVLRVRSGSLLPPFLAHAILNTITFVAAPYTDDPAGGLPDARPLLGLALMTVGIVAAVFLIRRIDSPPPDS
jgi:membrane protease YdiL (CAAX protease family)